MKNKKSMGQIKRSNKIASHKVTPGLENEDCKKGGKVDYRERNKKINPSSVLRPNDGKKIKGYKAKPKHPHDEIPEAPEDGPEL